MFRGGQYAGWIVVDLHLLGFLLLLVTGITLLILGFAFRRRQWHEYVTLFVAIFLTLLACGLLLLHGVFHYPVVVERHFFPLK